MTTMYSALVYPQCPAGGNYARPPLPSTFTGDAPALVSPTWNPYSANASDRTEWWADTAGTLSYDDALLACYGLAGIQQQQIATLTAAYQSAIAQPVSYTSKGGVTKTYQADPQSLSNLQNTLLGLQAAGTTPSGFYWVASDNTQVPFTYADLQGLASAMLAQGWAAFQQLQTLKTQVLAATTVAAVQAIVW